MNNVTLTIELGPESRALLHKILKALQGSRPDCSSCTETALQIMGENLKAVTGGAETAASVSEAATPETCRPVDETSAHVNPEPVATPETPTTPEYTKADVQALVQKLAAPTSPEHKRTGARAIVKSYGAKVSDIPADKYAEVMDKLTALDKEG